MEVRSRAPGKIILAGEHAVVHGSSAVAAAIDLYTNVHFQLLPPFRCKPAKVVVTSDLPLCSGLGSSASFCVSISAALLALSDAIFMENKGSGWLILGGSELELVNRWAYEGEKIIHGKPSGIDNTVSTFGSMPMFRSGELTRINSSTPLKMLITNTKVGRNTKALVAGVYERASRHPDAMSSVFTAVDYISKEMSSIIESPALDNLSVTAKEEKIEELMEMNQGLLQCMGVSHVS